MNSMTSIKDYYQYMSEADDNWFIQNSRFIAERDKNTQIHNADSSKGIVFSAQIHSPTRLSQLAKRSASSLAALSPVAACGTAPRLGRLPVFFLQLFLPFPFLFSYTAPHNNGRRNPNRLS